MRRKRADWDGPRGERPERAAGYGEQDRYRADPRGRSDEAERRRRGFVRPDRHDWRDETYESPGFAYGAEREPRFLGPPWRSGWGPHAGDFGGVERDRPDPSRGRRPRGPEGWAWGGLGYEPEPAGGFSGVAPRSYRRDDGRIREDVCDALTHDGHVDASEIEVDVRDAVVFLRGTVSDRAAKRRAGLIAEHMRGVHDVMNELRLDDDRARTELGGATRTREPSNGHERG